MYNIPKLLVNTDIRCIVLDNHRPTHLANVHNDYNVIVLENEDVLYSEKELIPENGDDLSGADNNTDGSDEDSDAEDDDDDDDVSDVDQVSYVFFNEMNSFLIF